MYICYVILGIMGMCLSVYLLLEAHYFGRALLSLILAKICRKRVHILSATRVNGICLTTDVDNLLTHMNNARFIRELDFAKIDFYCRTGLLDKIRKSGGSLAIGATTIRYRRFIKLFSRYYITSKIIYWDDKSIYMEHKFVTPANNFINAIALCRIRLIKCNAETIIDEMLNSALNQNIELSKKEKPELPLELAKWIECNEISSALLRSETL